MTETTRDDAQPGKDRKRLFITTSAIEASEK